MTPLTEITRSNLEKARKLEHRRRQKKYAEAKRKKAHRDALTFRVGEIVLECWPQVAQLQVHQTKAENDAEFAPLRELLMKIASNPDYTIALSSFATAQEDIGR